LPLHEIISLALKSGINSKSCWNIYNLLIEKFHNEFNVLINVSRRDLEKALDNQLLADLIILNRESKIIVKPGYDGQYGTVILEDREISLEEVSEDKDKSFENREKNIVSKKRSEVQKKLF
jgi:PHP family Zn ribbon phosphoesterase